jgi:hypothetical protein
LCGLARLHLVRRRRRRRRLDAARGRSGIDSIVGRRGRAGGWCVSPNSRPDTSCRDGRGILLEPSISGASADRFDLGGSEWDRDLHHDVVGGVAG